MKKKQLYKKHYVSYSKLLEPLLGVLCGCGHRKDAHQERIVRADYKIGLYEFVCLIKKCSCPGFEEDNLEYLKKLKNKRDTKKWP